MSNGSSKSADASHQRAKNAKFSEINPSGALVLFSGGQDSTTCLAWALSRFNKVETVGFNYGQRHAIELECRGSILDSLKMYKPEWQQRLGEDHVLDIRCLGEHLATGLTRDIRIDERDDGRPNTYVPGRNLIFLTLAAALADTRGLSVLVGGMCQADNAGYPDCRDDTIKAMQVALNLGMAASFRVEAPLMWLDKSEIWRLAAQIGGDFLIKVIVENSHTCYLGDRGQKHPWGYGCGECPACLLRAEGYGEGDFGESG